VLSEEVELTVELLFVVVVLGLELMTSIQLEEPWRVKLDSHLAQTLSVEHSTQLLMLQSGQQPVPAQWLAVNFLVEGQVLQAVLPIAVQVRQLASQS
jgi:hypothetical protein